MSKKRKAQDDKRLYASPDEFYNIKPTPPKEAAAKAMYGRLKGLYNNPAWEDLDIDTQDHYRIAASHAIRAFYRTAESFGWED